MIRHTVYRIAAPDTATVGTWRDQAACTEVDPDLMFPDSKPADIQAARAVCAVCPVVAECLAAAMAEEGNTSKHNRWGIRGGLTPTQRRRLHERQAKRRTRAAQAKKKEAPAPRPIAECGTRSGYQRHRNAGEPACDACRQANTDADNRLRRTGTTKQAA